MRNLSGFYSHAVSLRASTLSVAVLVLTACATATPEVKPLAGVPIPGQWNQSATAGQAPLTNWWAAFGDPTLVELVGMAQQFNTSVGQAAANLRQARAARQEAASALWPSVSVSASAQRVGGGGAGGSENRFQAGFDAGWELDLFGATRHGVAAQQALERASAATLASTQVSIAAEVALSYLQLRAAQARAAVARQNLASQEETLQISQWRQQGGLGSSLEVEQALGAVEQTRAQLPGLEASVSQSAHALSVLTGQPPATWVQRLATPAPLPRPPAGLEIAIPARALSQRPDVLAAQQRLQAAAEQVGQADRQRYPSVNLQASLAWSGLTLGSLGSVAAARSVLASVAQPLFDAGARNARLAAREAEFDEASESYRAQVLAALQEVEDALASLAGSRERLVSLQRAQESARAASLLANQRYISGLIDFQTVLETQRNLLNVQDSVVATEADLASAHVRLYKALGGGWQPAAAETPV